MTLPTGTITFLRSDIEGSMEHVRALGARYDELNAEHATVVRTAVETHGGRVVRTEGDAFFVVFTDAGAAARAAIEIQRKMAGHAWPAVRPFKVRVGLHTGAAVRAGDDYGGFEVNRAARIAAMGHGGQIVVSDTARALIATDPPDDARLVELGTYQLAGVVEPERLFGLVAPGLATQFPPLRGGHGAAERLPERHASIIGREPELATLSDLLTTTRLLTLTGPGGTGKTTLAVELARRHAAGHRDGAWFVDMQGVDEPQAARVQVARDLGLFDGPMGPAVERLLPYVADRELLVVIDNLEQLRDAAALVAEFLDASRASRVITTSRIPLRLAAEQEYPVRPLGLNADDDGASDAVRLFRERARKSRPDLVFGSDELVAVEHICRLVDGLPLAIELCAARVAVLPVARIHERLSKRLPLPGSGPRDLPARQRTIEDTVAWSFELLDPPLQRLFVCLGVFAASFDLEQAEEVCGGEDLGVDVLDGLARLVEHSLLMRVDDAVGGVRFGMLETIRLDAQARLKASEDAEVFRARHARAYLGLAERMSPAHREPIGAYWLDRLEGDDGNLHQAIEWAMGAGDVEMALGLAGYLWRYWVHSGRLAEGRDLTEEALRLPDPDAPSEARVWGVAAAGSLAYWSSDPDTARAYYEEQLALATDLDISLGQADAWFNLIFIGRITGDFEGAETAAAQARRILTDLGEPSRLDEMDAALAATSAPAVLSDPEALLPLLEEQIARLERSESPLVQSVLPGMRATRSLAKGDIATAGQHLVSALRVGLAWRRVGEVIVNMTFTASLMVGRLDADIPATLLGAVEAAIERYGVSGPRWSELLPSIVAADPLTELAVQLGPDGLEQAMDRGRRMTLEEAIDFIEERVDALGPA